MSFLRYFDKPLGLPKLGELPAGVHVFDDASVDAINAALAAERPLLVRGEPGTGKSQLARAAAAGLELAFVSMVIDARTEARDLHWSLDAVARLADAQVNDARRGEDGRLLLDPYLAPGPLWWAFNWKSAKRQASEAEVLGPKEPDGWEVGDGVVVLLDEIDKADVSVPNGLLEALGQGSFKRPGGDDVVRASGAQAPLVVVTTNEERALPDAFLRRCLVLQLSLPDDGPGLTKRLMAWGTAHFPECAPEILELAATMLAEDRPKMRQRGLAPPGGAEYIDLLRSVIRMAESDATPGLEPGEPVDRQRALLERNRRFTFDKHPPDPRW